MDQNDSDYCLRLLRQGDYDRYLMALYAPKRRRDALLALYALAQELSQVAGAVSESITGEIRFAWWQEGIAGVYAGMPRAHPVLRALNSWVDEAQPPRALFEALIEAHRKALYEDASTEASIGFCQAAGGSLGELSLLALTGAAREEWRIAARQAGIAQMASRLLRQPRLPRETTLALSEYAQRCLQASRQNVPSSARAAFIGNRLVADHLNRLHRADYDIADVDLTRASALRQLKLFWAALTGRY